MTQSAFQSLQNWKVYKNLPEKIKLFHRYERATEYVLRRIARGEQMADIIQAISG